MSARRPRPRPAQVQRDRPRGEPVQRDRRAPGARHGGRVTHELPIVGGFSAVLPAKALNPLAMSRAVIAPVVRRPRHHERHQHEQVRHHGAEHAVAVVHQAPLGALGRDRGHGRRARHGDHPVAGLRQPHPGDGGLHARGRRRGPLRPRHAHGRHHRRQRRSSRAAEVDRRRPGREPRLRQGRADRRLDRRLGGHRRPAVGHRQQGPVQHPRAEPVVRHGLARSPTTSTRSTTRSSRSGTRACWSCAAAGNRGNNTRHRSTSPATTRTSSRSAPWTAGGTLGKRERRWS